MKFLAASSLLIAIIRPVLAGYYMSGVKAVVVKVVLVLMLVQSIGALFRILHLPSGEILSMTGPVSSVLFGSFVLYKNFKTRQDIYFYLIGFLILLQAVIFNFMNEASVLRISIVFQFLILAVIGTIKLRKLVIDNDIDKVLNIYLIINIIIVVSQTARMLNYQMSIF